MTAPAPHPIDADALRKHDGWRSLETIPTTYKVGDQFLVKNDDEASSQYGSPAILTYTDTGWALSRFFIVPGGKHGRLTSRFDRWKPLQENAQ